MSSLVEFLLARIAEAEARARAAEAVAHSPWEPVLMEYVPNIGCRLGAWTGSSGTEYPEVDGYLANAEDGGSGVMAAEVVLFLAGNDPARVLADCTARRRIIELHSVTEGLGYTDDGYGDVDPACRACGTSDEYAVPWPCGTVRALASVYSDHPDFDPGWGITE
jgi:hypothetical protein